MNNDRLMLKDSTEITLESSQGMNALHVNVADKVAACTLWGKFSKENLKHVTIENSEGITVGTYSDMVLDHVEGRDNADGTVRMTFSLRSKTTEEILTERILVLESGQQTQDEAISDLGQVVSDIAEGGTQ